MMREEKIINYNYDAIKYFLSVARHGSLSKSANSLGISQSALSQSMKNLEESLGVTLFTRNTRGIILTAEGKALYENALTGNDYFEKAITEAIRINKFDTNKTFRISLSGTLFNIMISPIMNRIVKKYPNVNFEFTTYTPDTDVAKRLLNCKDDLIIIKTDEKFNLKEVNVKELMELNFFFAYNPKFYRFNDIVYLEDIKDVPIIRKKRIGKYDNTWVLTEFKQTITCTSDKNILELIKGGAGIGFYPAELVKKEGLKSLELKDYKPIKRIVEACYLNNNAIALDIIKMIEEEYKI